MARIRTVKPDHWEDDNWNNVSLQAHLLFIGMKNFADDRGVIRDNAVLIKNKVFPTREDIRTADVQKWLKELLEYSFLVPLQFENKGYYVLDFSNEKIDKPQPSIIPNDVFYQHLDVSIEHSRTFENIPAVEESRVEESRGKERKGRGEDTRESAALSNDEIFIFFKKESNWPDDKSNRVAKKFKIEYEVKLRSPNFNWQGKAKRWIATEVDYIENDPNKPHPDYWDQKHADKLFGKAYSDYTSHLHSIGLKPVKNGQGKITDFVKNEVVHDNSSTDWKSELTKKIGKEKG